MPMNRPNFLSTSLPQLSCLTLVLFLMQWLMTARAVLASQSRADIPKRPDILWLIAEDFGPQLGCYGAKEVWPPNLDHLAAEGMRYTVRDTHYRYIRNFTPERSFLQPNAYKERSYPVWNLLKELHAKGKLRPVQAVLCAPSMPAEELYDLDTDPYEIHNLANSKHPEHQSVLKRLRTVLENWIDQSNDQGRVLEPPELAAVKGATKPRSDPNAGSTPTPRSK